MIPWIGFDLDGTLAEYVPGDIWQIGKPIEPMMARLRAHIEQGQLCKIFTARVAATGEINGDGVADDADFAQRQRELIQAWCRQHLGTALAVTATKDFGMLQFYDDRAAGVLTNTGHLMTEVMYALGLRAGKIGQDALLGPVTPALPVPSPTPGGPSRGLDRGTESSTRQSNEESRHHTQT